MTFIRHCNLFSDCFGYEHLRAFSKENPELQGSGASQNTQAYRQLLFGRKFRSQNGSLDYNRHQVSEYQLGENGAGLIVLSRADVAVPSTGEFADFHADKSLKRWSVKNPRESDLAVETNSFLNFWERYIDAQFQESSKRIGYEWSYEERKETMGVVWRFEFSAMEVYFTAFSRSLRDIHTPSF